MYSKVPRGSESPSAPRIRSGLGPGLRQEQQPCGIFIQPEYLRGGKRVVNPGDSGKARPPARGYHHPDPLPRVHFVSVGWVVYRNVPRSPYIDHLNNPLPAGETVPPSQSEGLVIHQTNSRPGRRHRPGRQQTVVSPVFQFGKESECRTAHRRWPLHSPAVPSVAERARMSQTPDPCSGTHTTKTWSK